MTDALGARLLCPRIMGKEDPRSNLEQTLEVALHCRP